MASSLSGFDLKTASDVAVGATTKILAPMSAFGIAVEAGSSKAIGETIIVPFVTESDDATAFNASSNNFSTDNGGQDVAKGVTITAPLKSTFIVAMTDIEKFMKSGILQKKLDNAAAAVARGGIKKLQTLLTISNYGVGIVAGAASAFDTDVMVDIRKTFRSTTGADAYWAVLADSHYAALLKDLGDVSKTGFSDSLIMGRVPGVVGFKEVIETNILDANSENRIGFVSDGTGLVIANHVTAPYDEAAVDFSVAVDPVTGIAMGFSYFMDKSTETVNFSVRASIDVAVGRAAGLKLLVTAGL